MLELNVQVATLVKPEMILIEHIIETFKCT